MAPYSVIVPALNEEEGIRSVVDRLHALSPRPEVIVIDDGSTDRTGEIARDAGAVVIRHPAPGGYGRSLKDGILAASNDIVGITDGDGTYPVERLPELVRFIDEGFDMAVGARQGKHYRGSLLKMPARILFTWLVEFTIGRLIPDINSGLRVFRKSDAMKHFADLCNGFSFTTTITLIYMLTGRFVRYMPIDYGARTGHSKVRFIQDTLRTLQYITEVIAIYNPLKLYVLLGAFLGIIGLIGAGLNVTSPGEGFLFLACLFFVGAFVIFALGILAYILSRSGR